MNGKILIVDDDADNRNLMREFLGSHGYETIMADDGQTALEQFEQFEPDLVLLDVELPEMNGFELCTKLRALPGYENVPVIYVTAHSDFENRAKGALTGGYDLIAKPILPMELAVKVVTVLMKKHFMS